MSIPQVSLVLHHPDALRVLSRALDNAHTFYAVQAVDAAHRAEVLVRTGHAAAAKRQEARAVEFARRRDLTQGLRAQLPTTPDAVPLPAPEGL